jgi:hypothetical protein
MGHKKISVDLQTPLTAEHIQLKDIHWRGKINREKF